MNAAKQNREDDVSAQFVDRELVAWVAEDDLEMRRMIVKVLRRSGFRVDEFCDGKELVERIEVLDNDSSIESPAIVIVDHLMPELHGLDAATRLKKHRAEIPFILITAFGDADLHRRAELLGAAAILDKPFDLDRFRDIAVRAVNTIGPSTRKK